MLDRLCYSHISKDDLKIAFQIHGEGGWIFSAKLRTILFSEVYVPMLQAYNQNTWEVLLHVSVDSRLKLLRQFEKFTLHTLSIASSNTVDHVQLPCLQYFVEDAVLLLRILNKPAVLSSSFEESHPFNEFNIRRKGSWSKRWNSRAPDSEEVWRDYICGLCDALFGLWPASGPGLFHEPNGGSGCVGTLLRAFIHDQRDPSVVPHVDYQRFDAAYIESRGPFRLKSTTRLDDHLLMTENNEILFYADWQRWACLTSLSVLHSKNSLSLFDVLMCAHRRGWKPHPLSSQIRTSLSQIFGDLATIGMLFFFQDNIHDLEPKKSASYFLDEARPDVLWLIISRPLVVQASKFQNESVYPCRRMIFAMLANSSNVVTTTGVALSTRTLCSEPSAPSKTDWTNCMMN